MLLQPTNHAAGWLIYKSNSKLADPIIIWYVQGPNTKKIAVQKDPVMRRNANPELSLYPPWLEGLAGSRADSCERTSSGWAGRPTLPENLGLPCAEMFAVG